VERLSLDYSLCMQEVLGAAGLHPFSLEALRLPLCEAAERLVEQRAAGKLAWMDLPRRDPADLLAFAREIEGRYENLLVLGIGGSALGTIALRTALLDPVHNLLPAAARGGRPRLLVLDNVDPDETAGLLRHLDLRSTLVNVVSKSGTTAETMAAYLIVRRLLEEQLGKYPIADHLVFTTDRLSGVLRRLGQAEGIRMFEIPPGVGGRFSVLSPVGLLPAALTGMDVRGLLDGAAEMDDWLASADPVESPAHIFAGLQFLSDTKHHRSLSVMMPYSSRLRDVADWFRQLWAESLGKAVTRRGRNVNNGMTPIKALGATDQHSQVQLYAEGPDDKLFTFIRVAEFDEDLEIPDAHPEVEELSYLAGHTLGELLNAEQEATAWALARRGRPSLTITLPRVDARAVGQLFFLLEAATAVMGELYDIDAFDQPGVELGKEATYGLMGRPGYESIAQEIRAGRPAGDEYLLS
jgi:glucose-6-phosphate isomerase